MLQCDGVVTQIVISKPSDMSECGCLSMVLLYCLCSISNICISKVHSLWNIDTSLSFIH